MTIEALKSDLAQIAAAAPHDPALVPEFLRNNLLPFLESTMDELAELDDCVENLVEGTEPVLHEEQAAVFAGVIEGAAVLIAELKARAGTDRRILTLIAKWQELAKQARQIIDDITMWAPDGEAEGHGDVEASPAPTPALAASKESP